MRQSLPRVPQDRIAVLIGAKGVTRRELETAAGCKSLQIDSTSGDIEVTWPEAGEYDPVKALKLPDVIKAVGRGMAPNRAIQLLQDDWFFEMVDLKEHVGKRSSQQRRIRARIIGSEGKIRKMIEQHTKAFIKRLHNGTVESHDKTLEIAYLAILAPFENCEDLEVKLPSIISILSKSLTSAMVNRFWRKTFST